MAHYAKIEDGFVTNVIVADKDFIDAQKGTWVETTKRTNGGVHENGERHLRKNFAGTGYLYDETRDAFYTPKPFESWILNDTTCLWDAPVAYPDDGKFYNWDESKTSWIETS